MEEKGGGGHLVFVPVPGAGHLIPTLELARRLRQGHDFTVTFLLIPPLSGFPAVASSVYSSFPTFTFRHLPTIPPPGPRPATRPQAFIAGVLDLYKPLVESALRELLSDSPISALILDFFCSGMADIGLHLNIPPFVFFTSGAAMLGIMLHITTLDPLVPDHPKPVENHKGEIEILPFPGFDLPLASLPGEFAEGKDEVYHTFLNFGLCFRKARGIVLNSFFELEPTVLTAMEQGLYVPAGDTPPVYAVGPVIALQGGGGDDEKGECCIRWLDEQPRGSVVFLCFGSMGRFGEAQVRETAAGLERSGHRFLWVMRDGGLPEGFVERTRERGLVWAWPAPQKKILAHEAVGGFVSHCGWNSLLESLWFGVPMAAWPLYAEQHLNAYEMAEVMGVAVEVRIDRLRGNAASAEEVERAVRSLMGDDGAAVRKKVKQMQDLAGKALAVDGSSNLAMNKLVQMWTRGDQFSKSDSQPSTSKICMSNNL